MLTVEEVRDFAYDLHKDQRYDNRNYAYPFSHHLSMVSDNARKYSYLLFQYPSCEDSIKEERVVKAAYLHDSVEDTNITLPELEALVGPIVTEIVNCLTDGKKCEPCKANSTACPKCNRKARHQVAFDKINASPLREQAIFVKLCDRLANVEHSVNSDNTKMLQMYRKEHEEFFKQIGDTYEVFKPMWDCLEELIQ